CTEFTFVSIRRKASRGWTDDFKHYTVVLTEIKTLEIIAVDHTGRSVAARLQYLIHFLQVGIFRLNRQMVNRAAALNFNSAFFFTDDDFTGQSVFICTKNSMVQSIFND